MPRASCATSEVQRNAAEGRAITGNGAPANAGLRALDPVKPLYMLPNDPLGEEVLIPAFGQAERVDCMVGFFSSAVLASLAPGLATYLAESKRSLRLVVSPVLRAEDHAAIEEGLKAREEAAASLLEEVLVTEDLLQQYTLRCLAWLVRDHRLDIRVALMKDAIFHPKVWLFRSGDDVVAVHGSSNATLRGLTRNIEQMTVSKSWQDATQRYLADRLSLEFSDYWHGHSDNCVVVPLPEATKRKLLATYGSGPTPTEAELRRLYRRALGREEPDPATVFDGFEKPSFHVPAWMHYEDGPFAHQGKAVAAWCDAGYRGVLEMATGSGKTFTSLIAAHRLYEQRRPLLILVATPRIPLVQQWCGEVEVFGLRPQSFAANAGARGRARHLQRLKRRVHMGSLDVHLLVVSHDTLCLPDFLEKIEGFPCERLLIADEVHNLGRKQFRDTPPVFFEHRLGLSATPIRQYDEEGSEAIADFFGPVVFRFGLEEAIGQCLVPYDYYVHPVGLTDEEMETWHELTERIRARSARLGEAARDDEQLLHLRLLRRRVLETPAAKLEKLRELLDAAGPHTLRHTLIYTSGKNPEQLDGANAILTECGVAFRQVTAEETGRRGLTQGILGSFAAGDIGVLTAKLVMDEGVNIPQIRRAYFLASTTVERQWVQRRGRLLRKCDEIGKTHAEIHDFIALPPTVGRALDQDAKDVVTAELDRARAFAGLSSNYGREDGAIALIDSMVRIAYI